MKSTMRVRSCNFAPEAHPYRWIVQKKHINGLWMADSACSHFQTREQAREWVREGKNKERFWNAMERDALTREN